MVTTWFGEDERAGAIAVYTSGQYVGLGFLTPLLSWIDLSYGWRAVFAVTGAVGLTWAVAVSYTHLDVYKRQPWDQITCVSP